MLFPRDFEMMMRGILGQSYERFAAAADEPCPVSVRLNDKSAIMVDSSCTPVEWCGSGFYLPERPVFALDPLWHCGAYYVQEASSMFLEQLYKKYVCGKVRILDLSAAPGGKYHREVMEALPSVPVTRQIEDVEQFIRARKGPDYFLP